MEYYKHIRQYVGHRPIILPGAAVIIVNDRDEILMQQRSEHGWGFFGGLMEMGESLQETARREVFEETGLKLGALQLIDVLSGPDYFYELENQDEYYAVTTLYTTRDYSGDIVLNSESRDYRFFRIEEIPEEEMEQEYRDAIKAYIRWSSNRDMGM